VQLGFVEDDPSAGAPAAALERGSQLFPERACYGGAGAWKRRLRRYLRRRSRA
jgi:hypothetical protein